MSSLNPQIRPRISRKNYERLCLQSRATEQSHSDISDQAFSVYFQNLEAKGFETALMQRLDHTTNQLFRLDRDVKLLTDAFTLYLQYFFTVIPNIEPAQSEVRAAQGVKHFHDFLDRFREFTKSGGANIKNAVEDVLVTDKSHFNQEDIQQLKQAANDGGAS